MNFGMGLTRVTFQDYIVGTGPGIMVGAFIFIFSFFIPKIIKKVKAEA
jgi:uncharacterized membrane protein YdjX (TVP38/TMEM64 family)